MSLTHFSPVQWESVISYSETSIWARRIEQQDGCGEIHKEEIEAEGRCNSKVKFWKQMKIEW